MKQRDEGESAAEDRPDKTPAQLAQIDGLMRGFDGTIQAVGVATGGLDVHDAVSALLSMISRVVETTSVRVPEEARAEYARGIFASCQEYFGAALDGTLKTYPREDPAGEDEQEAHVH